MLTLPPPPPSSLLACKSRRRSSHLSVRAHAHNAALCTTCLLQTSVPCILNSYAWGEIAIVIGEKQDQATGHNTFAFEIPYLAVVEGKGTASLFFRFAFSSLTISSFTPPPPSSPLFTRARGPVLADCTGDLDIDLRLCLLFITLLFESLFVLDR